ncbi:MAG: PssE/Cps14G family polysaccharide biosynthesis glycosyltransferase [Sedimentisphaerales bacterium]
MIFLTVGTQFPFDRLVKAVDEAVDGDELNEQVFAQIGVSSYRPRNFESVPSLEKAVFEKRFREADSIISHSGIGSITMALEHKKPLLVMPRLKRHREVVNDHQLAIAREFEKLGYLLVAYEAADLPAKIEELKQFVPQERQTQADVVAARISTFLDELCRSRQRSVER